MLAVPAHDARLDATVVAEPGDTLWMRLIDADANERPRAVDTASIKLINGEDTRTVYLEETGLSDSVFFGHLVTGDAFPVAGGDTLRPTYRDPAQHRRHRETGLRHHARPRPLRRRRRQRPAAGLRRLPHPQPRAGPLLTERDSLAANVDSLAPFGAITPYDAALVLQQRVGLLGRFPVQEPVAVNHPPSSPDPPAESSSEAGRPLAAERRLELRDGGDHLALWLDERSGIVAGDLLLQWEGEVEARLETARTCRASCSPRARLPRPAAPPACASSWPAPDPPAVPVSSFASTRREGRDMGREAVVAGSRFNDGRIPARVAPPAPGPPVPARFALHANHPNPFNAGTVIPFELAETGRCGWQW